MKQRALGRSGIKVSEICLGASAPPDRHPEWFIRQPRAS
jgi:aryl-alcohol dehydrogenase-like predicted oxidoreductase